MAEKSLAEIAFDAYQTFASAERKFVVPFDQLSPQDKALFGTIANRVYAEVLLRQHPDQKDIPMPFASIPDFVLEIRTQENE